MQPSQDFCQIERLETGSRPVPSIAVLASRMRWHIRLDGFWTTLKKVTAFLVRKTLRRHPAPVVTQESSAPPAVCESLDLRPGEWVEVKSEAEIRETLDQFGRHRGMLFMPEMARHCGHKLRVMKRLEQMLLESTMQVRRMRDTVLLEGAMCDGVGLRCDRSCFFYWREAWLRRSPPDPQVSETSAIS